LTISVGGHTVGGNRGAKGPNRIKRKASRDATCGLSYDNLTQKDEKWYSKKRGGGKSLRRQSEGTESSASPRREKEGDYPGSLIGGLFEGARHCLQQARKGGEEKAKKATQLTVLEPPPRIASKKRKGERPGSRYKGEKKGRKRSGAGITEKGEVQGRREQPRGRR